LIKQVRISLLENGNITIGKLIFSTV